MQGLYFRYLHKSKAVFTAALLAYAVLFVLTAKTSGQGMAVWGILPVIAAGTCWGWKAGLIAGTVAFPVNMLMMMLVGIDWQPGMLSGPGIVGHAAFVLEGLFLGCMRDLYVQRQQASEQLQLEINRRARDTELLRTAEQRLDIIIQESVDAIVIISGSMISRITMVNRSFLELVGRSSQALELFKKNKGAVKAVLLDLIMPRMTSKDTYLAMKKIDPQAAVIIISGVVEDERIDELFRLGVKGFLEKPLTINRVGYMLHDVLRGQGRCP